MARSTLDGKVLLDGSVSWGLRAGVAPVEAEFEVSPDDADALTSGGNRPVTLKIDTDGADGVEIQNLYVIQKRPAENAHTSLVRVVDRRFWWKYTQVSHEFNVRRNIGVRRVKGGFDRPELDPVEPDIRYAPWSLNNKYPWTAEAALKKVWETVSESEKDAGGPTPTLSIDPNIKKLSGDSLPIEDVALNDDGASAIARLLAFIPGAQITVDANGSVRVYSVADGSESEVMDAMLPEQDGDHAEFVKNHRIRPREVRIYFAPEAELRIDYEEVGDGGSQSIPDALYADNVLPVTDHSLSVPPFGPQATGTWITFPQAFDAWGAVPGGRKLSKSRLRRAMVPFMDLWTGVRIAGLGDDKADWGSRIGAAQTHYRRTYRINQKVVYGVRAFRAYRVATINHQTGSRAPATAYQDWAVVATQRYLAVGLSGGASSFEYAHNFTGYPSGGFGSSIEGIPASPIEVTVADSDQGIIRLEFRADPFRVHEQFLPSKIDNIPNGDLTGGVFAWNATEAGRDPPELSATHKVAFVLTVIPATPNTKKRLFELVRKPSDVASLLPSTLQGGLSEAHGPPMDVYIGPGWETARIAWSDKDRKKIIRGLGLDADESPGDVNSLSDLVINLGKQKGVSDPAASLDAIANSVAAAVYAEHADRIEGSRTTPVTHKARITGFITDVVHRVLPDGEASTTATVGERPASLDLMSMMPSSTRKIILKLATSGKALV